MTLTNPRLTWTCHVCGNERPDHRISVYKIDRSWAYKLPIGTVIANVRYCNDRADCLDGAPEARTSPILDDDISRGGEKPDGG